MVGPNETHNRPLCSEVEATVSGPFDACFVDESLVQHCWRNLLKSLPGVSPIFAKVQLQHTCTTIAQGLHASAISLTFAGI
jgi:hypothetical protein